MQQGGSARLAARCALAAHSRAPRSHQGGGCSQLQIGAKPFPQARNNAVNRQHAPWAAACEAKTASRQASSAAVAMVARMVLRQEVSHARALHSTSRTSGAAHRSTGLAAGQALQAHPTQLHAIVSPSTKRPPGPPCKTRHHVRRSGREHANPRRSTGADCAPALGQPLACT